jgi:hypothetical protein
MIARDICGGERGRTNQGRRESGRKEGRVEENERKRKKEVAR